MFYVLMYQHICLSPHFDDAALSLGGALAGWQAAGEPCLIVTICSAPPSGELNSFAAYLHERWGAASDPIAIRRAEDQAAAQRLGADLLFLEQHDAIYRHAAYDSAAAIFGTPIADDLLWTSLTSQLQALAQQYPNATWYAPLAVGNHVDHQITHGVAAKVLANLRWYEDLPYSARNNARDQRLAEVQPILDQVIAIDQTLAIKLASVADYASQIFELFGTVAAMEQELSTYAASVAEQGFAERLWRGGQV
ncbi:2'-N-acetylparomamine deacetylase [Herpetosiphon gulosus]|uniref:2'-N-acetylparomamine deacetylase n=2 Tax=Herpetosiphon gulosus TaxID=1973496 RepID=A0ABP9X2W8_9CHLR